MSVDTIARITSGTTLVLAAAISNLVVSEHVAGADPGGGFGASVVVLAAFGVAVAVSGLGKILADADVWPLDDGRAGTVQNIAIVILLAGLPVIIVLDSHVVSEWGVLPAVGISLWLGLLAANRFITNQFDIAERLGVAFNQGESA